MTLANLHAAKTAERRQQPSTEKVSPNATRSFSSGNVAANVLALQRAAGNRAVSQMIQAKLAVSRRDDPYEQEADRVAEQVLHKPEPQSPPKVSKVGQVHTSGMQRRLREEDEETTVLQAREASGAMTSAITPNAQFEPGALGGNSQPLPETTRAFFEPRFEHDLSEVRIHTDAGSVLILLFMDLNSNTELITIHK